MFALSAVRLAVDSGLFVLIWIVQLIIYPSFHVIDHERFRSWHNRYTALIAIIVAPLMLAQLGLELLLAATGKPSMLRLLLIGVIWLSTVFFSVPCHRSLHQLGHAPNLINRLIRSNWIRTTLWSALLADSIRIFCNSFPG